MKIKFAKIDNRLNPIDSYDYAEAIIPSREEGNAGFDLYSVEKEVILQPHETRLFPTGLKSIIEEGYYAQIFERGSTGSKGIAFRAGVVDSNYRGQWFVALTNTTTKAVIFTRDEDYPLPPNNPYIVYNLNKAIAQFVVLPVPQVTIVEVTEGEVDNAVTQRGGGALGSSGK